MARQPIQNLQGYGQTSTPSATPVDAYSGAPAIPQVSKGAQLAEALGTVSGNVNRAARESAANKQELDKKKAVSFAARFKGEEGEFLDSVKLGETYSDLSEIVVATIVEDKHKNEFRNSTYDTLRAVDDDVKMDVVALEAMFDGLIKDAAEKTEGMDFVQSGAVMGTRSAINEMRREFSVFRDQKTRQLAKENTQANVFNILGKYDLNSKDGQLSATALVNDLNDKLLATSPFTKKEDKQQIVDSLIEYNKLNPDSKAVSLISRIPWLQSKETDAKLEQAAPQIADLAIRKLRNDVFVKEQEQQKTLDDAQSKLNALAEANDIDAIRQVQAKSAGVTGEGAATANAIYKMAEVAEASAKVSPDVSATNYTLAKDSIVIAATQGNAGTLEETLSDINNRTDIAPQEKAALLREVPNLLQGHKIIASDQHSTAFRNRFGAILAAYQSNPQLMVKSFSLAKQGMSAESLARDVWDNETSTLIQLHIDKNEAVPSYSDLYGEEGIYAKAEVKVQEKLQQIASVTPQENTEQEQTEEPQEIPTVTTQEEYDALPSGAQFLENGKLFTKP